MDFLDSALEQEIEKAKKQLESSTGGKRLISRGELEKQREEEYRRQQEETDRLKQEKLKRKYELEELEEKDKANKIAKCREALKGAKDQLEREGNRAETFNLPNEEVFRRLRAKGQPIRLFGESDRERSLRLRALELMEERFEGQTNEFQKALESLDAGLELEALKKKQDTADEELEILRRKKDSDGVDLNSPKVDASTSEQSPVTTMIVDEPIDPEHIRKDIDKLYLLIYYYLKRLLKEWEQALSERPEHVRRSANGKRESVIQKQSEEYMKPLFRLLKTKSLEVDVLARISEITHHMQRREYLKAQEYYLQLAIGNAPWPIGVTMVGIHERSSREKISSPQVAHVLNDETSRKYIQSLKRLMTFCQAKYPPSSRAMMA